MILPDFDVLDSLIMYQEPTLSIQDLDQAIKRSGEYMIRSIDSIGRFNYVVNTNPAVQIKPSYNMLRHAGAIYALGMYQELTGDPNSCNTALKAMDFVKQTSLGPVHKESYYGVWTFSDITLIKKAPQVKLGGCGLGLTAIAASLKCDSDFVEAKKTNGLGYFIRYMQKDNGGFYSKYIPKKGGKDPSWNSLYYPGEAILGLMYLNQINPNNKWTTSAIHGMNYLAQKRKGETKVEPDHWALIATNQLIHYIDEHKKYESYREGFINHAKQICEFILNSSANINPSSDYYGCMGSDGRTTPTATRLEGLLNAYVYIPKEEIELRKQMELAIHAGIEFLVRSQIKEGEFIGGIPRTYISNDVLPSIRINHKRNTEIRIDYVQHALSAMILYRKIFYS